MTDPDLRRRRRRQGLARHPPCQPRGDTDQQLARGSTFLRCPLRQGGSLGRVRSQWRLRSQLRDALESAQVRFSRINPRALQAQATRRRQLVEMRKQEATRFQQTADPAARADIRGVIAMLDRRIAKDRGADDRSVLAAIERRPRCWSRRCRYPHCRVARTWPDRPAQHRRTGRPRSDRARQRTALRSSIHRRRPPDRQDHPLSRSPPGVAPVSAVHPLPRAPPGSREIRQDRHHRHRQEARRHPQCHARFRHRLPPHSSNLITVAGKPGAVHSASSGVVGWLTASAKRKAKVTDQACQ